MIRSTLGAPLGGTTRGGHQGVESLALSLITPPNFGGGDGSCLPSTVVAAPAEPNVPVTCSAMAVSEAASRKVVGCPTKFNLLRSRPTVSALRAIQPAIVT